VKKVASGLPVNNHLWGAVDMYGNCTKIKSELLSDPSAQMTDERAQEIIDKAMESGSLKQRDVVGVITGLMESGKTTLLHHLFGMELPQSYTSTGVAERSLRGFRMHLTGGVWRCISFEDILKHLAPLIRAGMGKEDVRSLAKRLMYDIQSGQENPTPPKASAPEPPPPKTPQEPSPGCKELAPLVVKKPTATPLPELELVHMIDTGGQPELMEVMPSLIHNANLAMVLVDLRYTLDEYPPVKHHEKDVPLSRGFPSRYTGKDIIMKLLSTLHAKKSIKEAFRFIIVATHRDCVKDDLDARVNTLNTELQRLLLPAFRNELIIFKEPSEIAFVLDLKTPDYQDKKALELICKQISRASLGNAFDTPASFFVFEQDLVKFAEKDAKRDILSLEECKQVGARLRMNAEMVEAALILFHRQNTFLYFRNVLPKHVFVKPQVPLDIVNGIVRYSYKKLQGVPANVALLKGTGILTEEMLSYDEVSPHFKEGFYGVKDAIKLFCHTLTLAPLEPDTAENAATPVDGKKKEYLMMCLRPAIPDTELHNHIPESSDTVPLVVKFSSGCVPLGCFGSTISCLLSKYGWVVRTIKGGAVKCLAQNIASLRDQQLLVNVVLVDRNQYIEIHIDSKSIHRLPRNTCSELRTTVFGAIEKVFDIMRLKKDQIKISPAVVCSCGEVEDPHHAKFVKPRTSMSYFLECLECRGEIVEPNDKQLLWVGNAASNTKPTLPQLMRLQIPEKVGVNYKKFGTYILNDNEGWQVANMEACSSNPENIVYEILKKWLQEMPTPVTWGNLIQMLRQTELNKLADDVERNHRDIAFS
jgi:GTPase SAR1 family protein